MIKLHIKGNEVKWFYTDGVICIEGTLDYVPGFMDAITGTIEYTLAWLTE